MTSAPATATILVVEDDPQIAGVLTALLEGEGYRVRTGVDGGALASAFADPPGLVLLDVMMPGMDGAEVCRRLKADPRTRQVPVVFVSALHPAVLRDCLRGVPHEGIIRKPFDLDEVLDTVERRLRR